MAVSSVAVRDGRGVALRIPSEDFLDVGAMSATIGECMSLLGVSASEIDLVLDFEAIARLPQPQQAVLAIVNAVGAATRAAHERGFRRLIFCGSSIPDPVGGRNSSRKTEFERCELAAWRRLVEDRPEMTLAFGDYGVISPYQTKPSKSVNVPARIRIPTPDRQLFMRAPRDDYRQLSGFAIEAPEFRALPPSWGANAIRDCAGPVTSADRLSGSRGIPTCTLNRRSPISRHICSGSRLNRWLIPSSYCGRHGYRTPCYSINLDPMTEWCCHGIEKTHSSGTALSQTVGGGGTKLLIWSSPNPELTSTSGRIR